MKSDNNNHKEHSCFALFSGGLDSILVVKLMQKLGYKVIAIFFETPFFPSDHARQAAKENDIELEIIDISREHIEMMKQPRYGFGKNMNPCIDCHGLMFRKAGELMHKYGVDFLISGEVLGQRPMSQRNDALNSVAKLSDVKDLLVRPLSQRLLRDTLPIREGWVNKNDMLDIQGRGRYRQIELANEYGIRNYQNPGGGCLLTDVGFSRKLKDLFDHNIYDVSNINLLKVGRHFRLDDHSKFIVGRNNSENEVINKQAGDFLLFQTDGVPGPLGLLIVEDNPSLEIITIAASLLLRYNNKIDTEAAVNYGKNSGLSNSINVGKMSPKEVEKLLI